MRHPCICIRFIFEGLNIKRVSTRILCGNTRQFQQMLLNVQKQLSLAEFSPFNLQTVCSYLPYYPAYKPPVYKYMCLYPGHKPMCLYPLDIYQSVTKPLRVKITVIRLILLQITVTKVTFFI